MQCGEFDKRNKEFYKKFNQTTFFINLLNLKGDSDPIIFDVGAHKGESIVFFRKIFQNAQIYCFEPNPMSLKQIEIMNDSRNKIFNAALSNYDGTSDFNIQDISHLSSLHKINKKSKSSIGYADKEKHEVITVDVMTGDKIIKDHNIKVIDLLKIDVQSNEVKTLEGFKNSLNIIKNIIIEVSFYDFYKNKSSISEIEKIIDGFELYDIFEISKNPKTQGTDWATLIYKNKKLNA